MTAMAGSDVVQTGRPIFDDFFQPLWPYIGNNTSNVVFQMVKHLGGQFTGPKREIRQSPNVFQYIDCGTSCVTCCAVLLEPQLLDIMIAQFRNEKVSNHGSIPITTDCNVVAFIILEEIFLDIVSFLLDSPRLIQKQSVSKENFLLRKHEIVMLSEKERVIFRGEDAQSEK
ncbi:hypothetical protein TNCV_1289741 [Trichonephila clavipes]|nr:hypothetical protein TNCV_1289741 [Trichonephila clavipes]